MDAYFYLWAQICTCFSPLLAVPLGREVQIFVALASERLEPLAGLGIVNLLWGLGFRV